MAIKINFDNSFSNLPNKFYSKIVPEKTKKPNLIILNKNLCDELNLDYKNLASPEGVNFLSGNLVLKNSEPLAMGLCRSSIWKLGSTTWRRESIAFR